jgi:3',5'-cyclic-AMP phosphodiesterase
MTLDRRKFLQLAGLTGAAAAIGNAAGLRWPPGVSAPGSLDFVFFTDTHIEPELDAPHGCDMCFHKIAGLKPDFAIMGGDHVYDVLGVGGRRADLVFDLYKKTEQILQMPIYHTFGNHDAFGVLTKSGVAPSDPGYGKKLYEERIGKTYYSFDRKGYHFVVLDSIQPTDDRLWEARVDEKQLGWLAGDLKSAGPQTPIVVVIHVPLVTAFATYAERIAANQKYNTLTVANAPDVLAKFEGYNVIAVLQGHTHVTEVVEHKTTKFITSGAVCGNWWHGPRMGVPEGFMVVSLREGKISTQYETYGFHSVDPRERS